MQTMPRGSAHEIIFAKQIYKNRGRVPRFLYSQREKVSAWELSDVRVLRSQNTDCRKNEVFRQSKSCPMFFSRFFLFPAHFPRKYAIRLRILMVLHDFIKKIYCKSRKHFGQLETHLFKNYNAEYRDLLRNSRRFRGGSIENFRVKRYYRRNALCYAANIF